MTDKYVQIIAEELGLRAAQVQATIKLLKEDATVPFIARYRKEATGTLDEVEIAKIRDRLEQLEELDKRREAILKSLTERELLTPELEKSVLGATTLTELEDIYLPYRPKRRTRATVAKEKGLEPLAKVIFAQDNNPPIDLEQEASKYIDEEKGVTSIEEAIEGARDIIAEIINEEKETRELMRKLFFTKADIKSRISKGKEDDGKKYKDYFEWHELAKDAPSHRILAMMRGEKEKFLVLEIYPPEEEAIKILDKKFVHNETPAAEQVKLASEDSYKRLLGPSMETEIRNELKKLADDEAIRVFTDNLRELLLASPFGQKRVMALDPGFRTGCKLVCINEQGDLLFNDTIYPHSGDNKEQEARTKVEKHLRDYKIEAIAIGNGTASRETESFLKNCDIPEGIHIVMVNESGASIYSASEVAREEFPKEDVTVRGSVSIGRRFQDPLAELIKIDPKSIGVGQYQHDVDQSALKKSLDDVVMSCVNAVGVDLNTASKQLLTYVSGLGPQLASNIVSFRSENGPFRSRNEIKKVPRLGDKAFEQAAGFLRIRGGENPLDSSAVHPESYHIVEEMAKDLNCSISDLLKEEELRLKIGLEKYVNEKVGLPTLQDILSELAKPGRDPRETFEAFSYAEGVEKIGDLTVGMKLPGIVTNVTKFGAFVDIGVHQDGLVHISHLSDNFVKDPNDVVKVQQKVNVTVIEIDIERNRISLSLKKDPFSTERRQEKPKPKPKREAKPREVKPPKPQNNWFTDAMKKGNKKN
ncbi:MAG: RNA-binding transcriptional accessory protein [Acidobacteria bacterium]|nr:RNA-binding transcriptional accessory protein [Acidobacteriota bacterium]